MIKQLPILIIVIIATIILMICTNFSSEEKGHDPIIEAFLKSGANCKEVRLVAWGKFNTTPLNTDELQKIGKKYAGQLCLENTSISTNVATGWNQVIIDGENSGVEYQLLIQAADEATYIIIRAIGKDDLNYYNQLKEQLSLVLGEDFDYNGLITGELTGKLEQIEIKSLFDSIIKAGKGKLINTACEETYYSVNAYLEKLNHKIKVKNEAVNLEIAANYQETIDKTYIYFGLPLVFSDY